ncbi:dipeptidase PepV [Fredinandcohnia quinoae]|uniref:Dipeptidase PepV n=1 Tax=Fredinandcohnia quinoae TaxID=2918902 RepID=A0AAW5E1B8_9BACI|nr:dipeptidase PepV [Fredinandcohnia sp. SECRCQ15]MCH1625364.1 dipeptidase PepV [Fredinandcohnia sp. SECRCQ15]
MEKINWLDEVLKRKNELIVDTQEFLRIKSVLDEENGTSAAPFGEGIDKALHYLLEKGSDDGFTAKNLDGLAAHLEMGNGEELLGILCHIDVVPEGDGWTSDPYGAEIRDGKIFARGALDDKGPTMAAYYAMKIVKELNLPLAKRVRMIIGTDEESDWRCVDHYFKHEEMPTMGFAPDADFPIIYAEKGIVDFDFVQHSISETNDSGLKLDFLQAGRRYNMVPDFAEAKIQGHGDLQKIVNEYNEFLQQHSLQGRGLCDEDTLLLQLEGVSAHGMEPDHGKNAGLLLASFLYRYQFDKAAQDFLHFTNEFFVGDSRGKSLGVAYSDDITDDLTINVGKLTYTTESGGSLGLNLRYPVTNDITETKKKLEDVCGKATFKLENYSNSNPHHVDKDHTLIKTLQKVYEEQTGDEPTLVSIGGGTYARSLEAGVAFGPLFPGRPDIAHQKDEYIIIEDLIKATAIYAQAIYELAK